MDTANYRIAIDAEDHAAAGRAAQALTDSLRGVAGVLNVDRRKTDESAMDLGTIVTAVVTSGATLSLAKGVAAWLQARRGASITIEVTGPGQSIKAQVAGIDPAVALRIAEIVRG